MIVYNKLFALLALRGLKKTYLLNVVSSGTLAKLSKNKRVNTKTIYRICLLLHCQPGEIMEVKNE